MNRVSIIGGSIAGCLSALALKGRDVEVSVIERSNESLMDRGAAVVVPQALFADLKARDYIDRDTPHLVHRSVSFRTRRHGIDGDFLWSMPTDVVALRWGHLYEQLRKRVDPALYQGGASVVEIAEVPGGAQLTLDSGDTVVSDLVIAADGIHSIGRAHVWGDERPGYSGYILWRGLLDEEAITDAEAFDGIYWAPFNGGLAGAYYIAGVGGETSPGRRTLNWGIYDKMPLRQLTDLVPEFSPSNPAAYQIGEAGRRRLDGLAGDFLPAALRQVALDTDGLFIQPIVDILPGRLARGRTVLVGDACSVLRPHSASGISKAVQNVFALADCLSRTDDLDEALGAWQASQQSSLAEMSRLSQSLGAGMVTDAPDWELMRPTDMPSWWESMAAGSQWYMDAERAGEDR